jgi:hypothetical protein
VIKRNTPIDAVLNVEGVPASQEEIAARKG